MNILTVIGARPQFVKSWPVSASLKQSGVGEFLVHTGQHYDYQMSEVFFQELSLKAPDVNLEIGSGGHGYQTGAIMQALEPVMESQRPNAVLVYGDTNSTLAGALTAVKLQIPVIHVEAGLRSFNHRMPEEHNRVLTDHCSRLLLCPTPSAVNNLAKEGVTAGVHLSGDVMMDAVSAAQVIASTSGRMEAVRGLTPEGYYLATIHRADSTDQPAVLRELLGALAALSFPVILPAHPRLRQRLHVYDEMLKNSKITVIEPLGYIDMIHLLVNARGVFTDSGGLQKEAVWLGIPCVTLREETEWVETTQDGYNQLAGLSALRIAEAEAKLPPKRKSMLNSTSGASIRCVEIIDEFLRDQII